jgi:protein TonB
MFDLITGTSQRPLRERSTRSKVVAIAAHVVVVLAFIVVPLLQVTNQLPPVIPTMMAFVAPVPASPPPPPPPPLPAAKAAAPSTASPTKTSGQFAAPIEAPSDVMPERAIARSDSSEGVLGGIEGGVAGGVLGGIVGGIVSPVAAPPPPPPPSPTVVGGAPIHIGGQITAPALIRRVEPVYPDMAAIAKLTGVVILEATVDVEGCVESVKVLRSRHMLLDNAAKDALLQWQYSPLVLNGVKTPFILTVTFTFSVHK